MENMEEKVQELKDTALEVFQALDYYDGFGNSVVEENMRLVYRFLDLMTK